MNILQSDSIFKSIWLLPIIGGSRVSWKLNLINTVSQSTPLAVSRRRSTLNTLFFSC